MFTTTHTTQVLMRTLPKRCIDFLFRTHLAEKFTSPTVPPTERYSADEILEWREAGLLEWRNGFRLTAKGREELHKARPELKPTV